MSFMSKITTTLAVAAFSAAAIPASAAVVYSVTGDTSGGPVYNRPIADTPPTQISGTGTSVAYNTFLFSPIATGSYTFLLTSTNTAYDPFLVLYASPFNPALPLTNVIAANDDLQGSLALSGFTQTLLAGTVYTAVITGFNNFDFGTYQLTISNAAAVPEPATWGMMLAGFGMVGFGMRRRAKPSVRVTYA
ncbi:PEP-CTERM sorting domain-containing protein [Sphingomonas aliaeris]|uniref:PEP-CTERM sorting domain-containing protein n=1 Tax=Sphingomonas aliaeris TaxID=2759526 RepID=A0A974NWY2_9SPHN|nr:PEPxxWA-CTERM sorting domain-containing protein [Sphingomonas aliaeris]QQV78393.1 PEP-CTERM sorting domain-containing protein [Sphingomonas aliaeris]